MASRSKSRPVGEPQKNTRSAAAEKAAATRAANLEEQRQKRESRGVICIAAGVLLAAYLFVSGTGVLGEFLSRVLFGLCGWPAYILPVICIAAGIAIIRGSRVNSLGSSDWVFLLGCWATMTLAQIIRNVPYAGEQYFKYLVAAYTDGAMYRRGGGGIGAVMCYPLQQLGGNVLAYTVVITVLIITLIMITRLSVREVGARVGHGVQAVAQTATRVVRNADKKLFVMEVVDDDPTEVRSS